MIDEIHNAHVVRYFKHIGDTSFYIPFTPSTNGGYFIQMYLDMLKEARYKAGMACLGIDWAKDSGMNRGDVISRNKNVTEVRFKTVTSEDLK